MRVPYPFSAIVGQEEMKLAILIAAVDHSVGGLLVFGDRGTGKSTAIRALASLMPKMEVLVDCSYQCDPKSIGPSACENCDLRLSPDQAPKTRSVPVPVVDLPLGATEDRVVGALDIEKALNLGERAFQPGLLAQANRGFLYIDEVNLLEDHLVDTLLDVAVSGENLVEREGLSIRHPANFVLVGSGNPEEGELRPQLLDRFGLSVDVVTPESVKDRVTIIQRRHAYEADPEAFAKRWRRQDGKVRRQLIDAKALLTEVDVPVPILEAAAKLCVKLGTDGLRGELTLIRAARACASLEGKVEVTLNHLQRVAAPALRHRLRRDPLDESGSTVRVERALHAILSEEPNP